MYLKFGSKGDKVKELQLALNLSPVDGIYGRLTEAAVKNFQLKNGLTPDGVFGPQTADLLLDEKISTDISERYQEINIFQHHWMRKDQYVDEITQKEYIFLHHTAGSHHPYRTINIWSNDDRGRVGTEFVVGGESLLGDPHYDGLILQAFPDDRWAYHLGVSFSYLEKKSVGIEICNYGPLTEKNGTFYTYVNQIVSEDQIIELDKEFRGYKYFHNYTDKQLESVEKLLKYLSKRYDIDLKKGLKENIDIFETPDVAFEYFIKAAQGKTKGLLSHTNVRKDKFDVYPHPKLIEIIKSF